MRTSIDDSGVMDETIPAITLVITRKNIQRITGIMDYRSFISVKVLG
jgi:hypothetical protein